MWVVAGFALLSSDGLESSSQLFGWTKAWYGAVVLSYYTIPWSAPSQEMEINRVLYPTQDFVTRSTSIPSTNEEATPTKTEASPPLIPLGFKRTGRRA